MEITNPFHNTSITVRPAADGTISERTLRRAIKALCGMADCCCLSSGASGSAGILVEALPVGNDRYDLQVR